MTSIGWGFGSRGRRLTFLIAVLLVAVACGTPGATPSASSAATSPPSVAAASPSASATAQPVTITAVDTQGGSGTDKMVDDLQAAFMALHPNVTIKRVKISFNDYLVQAKLMLAGPTPPDIIGASLDVTSLGALVKAGLLLNLAPYAAQYKWADRYPAALWAATKFTADGKNMEGDPYNVFTLREAVGVFYNKKKLADLGLKVPTTFEEFEADLAAAKTAGQLPISVGDVEKFPAEHVWACAQNQYSTSKVLRDYYFRTNNGTFDTTENRKSLDVFKSWTDKGYLGSKWISTAYSDAVASFIAGTGVFNIDGTWNTGKLATAMGDNVGWFLCPPLASTGYGHTFNGGRGLANMASARTAHPDVVAQYLDFLSSDAAVQVIVKDGGVPGFASKSPDITSATGVLGDVIASIQKANADDPDVEFPGYATPSIGDTLGAALQALGSGKETVDQVVKAVQADYTSLK